MNGNRRTLTNTATAGQSSGGKNPYELRTELLTLAYQICYNQHVSEETMLMLQQNSTAFSDSPPPPRTSPDTREVIDCATELNDFISQKTAGGGHHGGY